MLGFSNGGLPRDPSTTGRVIWRMHFRKSCKEEEWGDRAVAKLRVRFPSHTKASAHFSLQAHLEKVEIDLFGVCVLFLVNRHEQILYIYYHSQEPVNLILRYILQVRYMVGCKMVTLGLRGTEEGLNSCISS